MLRVNFLYQVGLLILCV